VGRRHAWGYPIRGIVKEGMLYLRNYEPSRWPAGNPETGYLNCDGSPTKTQILELRRQKTPVPYWQLSFGKRPAEELYDLKKDPACMRNLANDPAYAARKQALERQMVKELKAQGDPRMFGRGHIFEEYPVASERLRNLYERLMRGEAETPRWINESDIQKPPE